MVRKKSKYSKPVIFDLGNVATLTAGSKSGGSEESGACLPGQTVWWKNTINARLY